MVGKRKTELKTTGTKKKKKQHMYDPGIRGKRKQHPTDLDWAAGLPDDLLKLVIKKLPLVDCLSFSNVCMSWRSIITNFFDRSSRGIPLLLKPGPSENESRMSVNVLDNNKNSRFDIPIPKKYIGSHIWGSYRDWLCLVRPLHGYSREIILFNPFSGEKVVLPYLNLLNFVYGCRIVVLSSVPSDQKCIVMLVHHSFGVAFWTSGAPREWCVQGNFSSGNIVDATYHERNFYLLTKNYDMVIIDEKSVLDNSDSVITSIVLGLKEPCLGKPSHMVTKYIVGSSGDILLVCRILDVDRKETCGIKTFRLDVSGRAWVKWESSLGNTNSEMIILGRSCSRSVDAKEELGDDTLGNKIYFSNTRGVNITNWGCVFETLIGGNDDDDWGVISLGEHRKETSDNWPRAFNGLGKFYPDVWVTAPIWWCLRQQTHKHNR